MHRKRTWLRTTFLAILSAAALLLATAQAQTRTTQGRVCPEPGFKPQLWVDDFDQLTAEMAAHYSDLEYAVEGRHMNLPKLRAETEANLGTSCNENDSKRVMHAFLDAFGDGHLFIEWPGAAESLPSLSASLCSRLGYKSWKLKPGIDFSQLLQFTNIGGEGADWFPGGILRIGDHDRLGVIRIPIFTEHAYPAACEQVVRAMRRADSDKCGEECENKIQHETGDLLTAAVVKRSALLQSAGATALLVDITENDGGSDWVDAVVRSLSNKPLREAPIGFIKHEHWTKELKERLAEVNDDLNNGREPRNSLREASARLQLAIALSREKCDRSSLWTDGKITCSLVVGGLLYSTGELAYAEPGSFDKLTSKGTLFRPLDYSYTESSARLPVYVVVDGQTWSSAEYFSFLLQDNDAATIFGEVSGGAGCGFTNGGIPTTLRNSHAVVKMPDCVHFRKDGSNANAGVTPDILVPWSRHDNSFLKAEKLYRSLAGAIAVQSKEAHHEAH